MSGRQTASVRCVLVYKHLTARRRQHSDEDTPKSSHVKRRIQSLPRSTKATSSHEISFPFVRETHTCGFSLTARESCTFLASEKAAQECGDCSKASLERPLVVEKPVRGPVPPPREGGSEECGEDEEHEAEVAPPPPAGGGRRANALGKGFALRRETDGPSSGEGADETQGEQVKKGQREQQRESSRKSRGITSRTTGRASPSDGCFPKSFASPLLPDVSVDPHTSGRCRRSHAICKSTVRRPESRALVPCTSREKLAYLILPSISFSLTRSRVIA